MARSRNLRRYRGWIATVVLVAIALTTFLVMRSAKAQTPTTTYTTEAAAKGTLSVTVSGTGNLELPDSHEVWPDSAGTVDSVSVEDGDKVEKGDVLYTLDGADAKAAKSKAWTSYVQAKSQVLQAEAQVTKAAASLSSLEDRADAPNSTVTSADIKAAKAELSSAKASLTAAKSSRSSALSTYDDAVDTANNLEVKSPITGTVWNVNISEGDSVSTGSGSSSASASTSSSSSGSSSGNGSSSSASSGSSTAPVVVVPNKPLVVTLGVNEVDLPSLKVGQRADVAFDALPDLTVTGKVTKIADEGTVSSGVVTFDVTVKLDLVNKQLKPGMSASATIVTNVARDVLLVPNAAVKTDTTSSTGTGSYVQVLQNGQSVRKDVVVGLASDSQTEIKSGLKAGDQVITSSSASSSSSSSGTGSNSKRGMGMMFGGPGR